MQSVPKRSQSIQVLISRVTGHVVLLRFHLSGYGVISNDAGRFKRFYSYFFCPRAHLPHGTRIASPWLPFFTCVPPTRSGRFASSIRCGPPNISSVTIDHDELCDLPGGSGSPNQSDGDFSHHNA